jgi:hypothetical protein
MLSRFGSGKQNAASSLRTFPSSPPCTISSIRSASGWYRQWNASMTTSPLRSAASATRVASAALAVKGFSHSTCLPASRARRVHMACSEFGSGM